jgi:hypothetical protein
MNCELFDLLDSFHHFECEEDKDRIYALAGLASDVQTSTGLMPLTAYQEKMPFVPHYLLSDDEVFRQVALRRIQSGRAFTTLAYAGALRPRNGSRSLSSWAPDFRLSKLWRTMLKEPDSEYQPTIELRFDGSLTLKGKVRTPYKQDYTSSGNKWDSCAVHNIFQGPTDSEPRSMLQFVRDCLHWMHSIPTLVNLEKDVQKIVLCDVLLTVAAKLDKEEYEMNDSTSDLILDIVSEKRLPLNTSKADGRDKSVRWLLKSLLDDEDSENKHLKGIMPYLSMIFKGLVGRCLFISNTVTISQRWGEEDMGGYQHFGISLLGIGPGDIEAGDVIVRFAGVEQSLFFRPEDGRHQVLGDGHFTVLPPRLQHEFHFSQAEIVLV